MSLRAPSSVQLKARNLSIALPRAHRRGETVNIGSRKFEIGSPIQNPDGSHELYLCRDVNDAPFRHPLVMKKFMADHHGRMTKMAHEAYVIFQSIREDLVRIGTPDILVCEGGYQVMNRAPGFDLGSYSRMRQGLSISQIHEIALQVSSIIATCMDLGFLHNDIKPGNIVVDVGCPGADQHWIPKHSTLIDWDIARPVIDTSNTSRGTPYYVSGERWLEKNHKTSDLFSLAFTLSVLLTGDRYGIAREDLLPEPHFIDVLINDRIRGTWLRGDVLDCARRIITEREPQDAHKAQQVIRFILAAGETSPEKRPQCGEEMRQILTDKGNLTEV